MFYLLDSTSCLLHKITDLNSGTGKPWALQGMAKDESFCLKKMLPRASSATLGDSLENGSEHKSQDLEKKNDF